MMQGHAEIESEQVGRTFVIRVSGYLNSRTGSSVGDAVDALLDSGGRRLLLNFERTKMMNSVGISSITAMVEKVAGCEGRAAFCSLAGMSAEIFVTMGATRGVRLFESESEALAWFDAYE
jgi:anti-anti-sigma factor